MSVSTFQQARLSRDPRFDGRFFVGVTSTGIFCRPICPARLPKEDNVQYYANAALAMQAGFRPCLRCRPDSAPNSFAWRGVDTTVERALKLITTHMQLDINTIAAKLGVSDRYLRQLFAKQVGMAPKHYQLSHRLLFAKKLLHETSLSIEQVAHSSGFQSARRLQGQLQKYWQLSPTQIRTHSRPTTSVLQLKLAYRPPYHWPQWQDFMARRAINGMEWIGEHYYARTFRINQQTGYFKATHHADEYCFNIEMELQDMQQLHEVLTSIRRILDLDTDSDLIASHLQTVGLEQGDWLPGLRLPGIWDPFEAGCRAILGQQISVTAAVKLVQQLVDHCGDDDQHRRIFPTPAQVADSDLNFLAMPDARRQTLRRFAEALHEHPNMAIDDWLAIKGIGPWTINYAKMRGTSDPDIFLQSDLVIRKQLQHLNLTPDKASPWGSYLTFLLWSKA